MKINEYLTNHRDAAAVLIKRTKITGMLTVNSVDGRKPVFFTRGIQTGFYLLPGEHLLSLSYQWVKINFLAKLFPHYFTGNTIISENGGKKEVFAKACGKYTLRYEHSENRYIFEKQTKKV